jgi:hypothetical protein
MRALRNSTEAGRWAAVLGCLLLVTSAFVAGALSLEAWLLLPAVGLVPVWPAALAYLALRSDTNATPATNVSELPQRTGERDSERRAA